MLGTGNLGTWGVGDREDLSQGSVPIPFCRYSPATFSHSWISNPTPKEFGEALALALLTREVFEFLFNRGFSMVKKSQSQRHASLYNGMSPVQILELSIALEEAIMVELHHFGRGGERGWRRFLARIARRVCWSYVLEDRESRDQFEKMVSYKLNELLEHGVIGLTRS
jgi:hypothetical protein